MNNIFDFYDTVRKNKNYMLVYNTYFEIILQNFSYSSQNEFEKSVVTPTEYQQIIDEFEKFFQKTFSVEELLPIINQKIYYPIQQKDLYKKVKNAKTFEPFIKKVIFLQQEYDITENKSTQLKTVGRPKDSYNICFVACLIDFIKQEYQTTKRVNKHIKINNLAQLKTELNSIDTSTEYKLTIKKLLDNIEERYFLYMEDSYKIAYKNIEKIIDFKFLILENQNYLIKQTNIDTNKISILMQDYFEYFIEHTFPFYFSINKKDNTSIFTKNKFVLENIDKFRLNFSINAMTANLDYCRYDLINYKFKTNSIFYFISARERIEKQINEDSNNGFYNVDNHIQLLKDFSRRYIENTIAQAKKIQIEVEWQFHLSAKNPIRQLMIEGMEASNNTIQTQQLREFLIDYKWL